MTRLPASVERAIEERVSSGASSRGHSVEYATALGLIASGASCDLLGDGSCGFDGCNCAEALAQALIAVIEGAEQCPDSCRPDAFEMAQQVVALTRAR